MRIRYSIRILLAVMTVLAALLGYNSQLARRQKEAAERVLQLGGSVEYDYRYSGNGTNPNWLRGILASWFGEHFVYSVQGAGYFPPVDATPADYHAVIDAFSELPSLRKIAVWPAEPSTIQTGKAMALNEQGGIDDESALYLLSKLPKINHASFMAAHMSDETAQKYIDDRRFETIQISRAAPYSDRVVDYYIELNQRPIHWLGSPGFTIPDWRPQKTP